LCMVMAGLFKEPGWVVYPCTAAIMALGAWRRGDPRRVPSLVAGLVVVGGLGFLWSHTSANVDRLGADLDVLGKLRDLRHAVRPWADRWPGGEPGSRAWKGIALPLIGLGMAAALVLRRRESPTEAQGRAIILGTTALTGVGYIRPDWVGGVIGLGLVAMIFVHRSGIIAVLAALSVGVMFLFPGPNPVQILPAAMAFAALIAIHAGRLVGPGVPSALRLFAGIILAGGLGHQALQLADRLVDPDPSSRDVPRQLQDRDQLLAEGALFQGLEMRKVFFKGELGARFLGPLVGFQVIPYDRNLGPYSMQVSDGLWVDPSSASAEALLLDNSLLDVEHTETVELSLEPGYYAAGMVLADISTEAEVRVRIPCKDDLRVHNARSGTVWVVKAFRIPQGCGAVQVDAISPHEGAVNRFFLTPLPEPDIDLRGGDFHAPVLGLPPVEAMPEKR